MYVEQVVVFLQRDYFQDETEEFLATNRVRETLRGIWISTWMAHLNDKAFWNWIESHEPKSWELNATWYNNVFRRSVHRATVDTAMEDAATRIQAIYVTDLQAQAQAQAKKK